MRFSWLTEHALFCHILFEYKFLWCLKTAVKSHDFHSVRFHESDWLIDSELFLLTVLDTCSSDEQTACCVSQSFFESVQQWLFLSSFQQCWARLSIFKNVNWCRNSFLFCEELLFWLNKSAWNNKSAVSMFMWKLWWFLQIISSLLWKKYWKFHLC